MIFSKVKYTKHIIDNINTIPIIVKTNPVVLSEVVLVKDVLYWFLGSTYIGWFKVSLVLSGILSHVATWDMSFAL